MPQLSAATVLVELHEWLIPDGGTRLLSRFQATHHIEIVCGEPRKLSEFPELSPLPSRVAEMALSEGRPHPMRWALLTPWTRITDILPTSEA